MRTGSRNRIISIESKTPVTDSGYGGPVETWSEIASVWANVIPVNSKERVDSGAVASDVEVKFNIIWMLGVTDTVDASMRVVYNGNTYRIVSVIDVYDEHKEIDILAKSWGE